MAIESAGIGRTVIGVAMPPDLKLGQPPPRMKLSGVEAGRGVAAVLVVLYHAALHIEAHVGGRIAHGIAHFGHAGVDFFFVLSGFIISFVHHKDIGKPRRLAHYAQRRFTRVFPLYWIVLAYYLADQALFHRDELPGVVEGIFNVFLLPHAQDPIVGGAWTLVFEVLFYAVIATAICSRRVGAALLGAWALIIVLGLAGHDWGMGISLMHTLSSPFCLEFFLGIGAAYVLLTRSIPHSSTILIAGIVAFGLAGITEVAGILNGFGATARVVYGGCSVLIVLGLVERERSGKMKVPKPMALIGQASYSVYLVHLIAIGLAFKYLARLVVFTTAWSWALWLALSAFAIVAGILTSMCLERPSINFFRARFSK
jgi:exopolysaccharide production protein ExoZ